MNPAMHDVARHSGLREQGFCESSSVGLTGNNLWIRLIVARLPERAWRTGRASGNCIDGEQLLLRANTTQGGDSDRIKLCGNSLTCQRIS